MNGEINPYLKEGVDWHLIKAQGLESIDGVVGYGVSEDVISAGAFVTIVIVACALCSLGRNLCRVCFDVMPFTINHGFLKGGDVLGVGI